MKVLDLISALKLFDPNLEVFVDGICSNREILHVEPGDRRDGPFMPTGRIVDAEAAVLISGKKEDIHECADQLEQEIFEEEMNTCESRNRNHVHTGPFGNIEHRRDDGYNEVYR